MWSKHSYKNLKRYMDYFDPSLQVFETLGKMPPIVSFKKVLQLKKEIADCEDKKNILLHTGDCAEPF